MAVEEMAPEYRFDYSKARPNRFAKRGSKDAVMIVLDPDVAVVFQTSEQVNSFLRATVAAVRKPRARPSNRSKTRSA